MTEKQIKKLNLIPDQEYYLTVMPGVRMETKQYRIQYRFCLEGYNSLEVHYFRNEPPDMEPVETSPDAYTKSLANYQIESIEPAEDYEYEELA